MNTGKTNQGSQLGRREIGGKATRATYHNLKIQWEVSEQQKDNGSQGREEIISIKVITKLNKFLRRKPDHDRLVEFTPHMIHRPICPLKCVKANPEF